MSATLYLALIKFQVPSLVVREMCLSVKCCSKVVCEYLVHLTITRGACLLTPTDTTLNHGLVCFTQSEDLTPCFVRNMPKGHRWRWEEK